MAKSAKPTGLTMTRSGGTFTCSWKFGESDYGNGQEFRYALSGGKWIKSSVTTTAKTKALSLNLANYYPHKKTKLTAVTFQVRGNKKGAKGWSDRAGLKKTLSVPSAPSISKERDEEHEYVTKFMWETSYDNTNFAPFANVELQTMLVKDNPSTTGWKLNWSKATSYTVGATSYKTFSEDTSVVAGYSYTRWVRVRSRGCAGDSTWRYSYQTYAAPLKAKITKATVVKGAFGYQATVDWDQSLTSARPIDVVTVQYAMETPTDGLNCPAGASWNDARILAGKSGANRASFPVDDTLDEDKCLYVRIVAQHDTDITYSDPFLAEYGMLQNPTGLTIVSRSEDTHRVTISATNNSDVPDAFLAVVYLPASKPDGYIVGVSSNGSGAKTISNIQCPDWSGEASTSFGVYAVVGNAELNGDYYSITPLAGKKLMRSKSVTTSGGYVPKAPENVAVSNDGNNNAVVSWDWSWLEADSAEISWSDRADAWQSTEEPTRYTVDGTNLSWWKVVGLETGKQWYFRVRLIKTQDETQNYGAYSDVVSLNLSAAPATPMLHLSSGVTADEFTCYWDYVSGDGTGQAYAEICEATIDGGGITYSEPIASARTESHITLSASELGWEAGTEHNLCVSLVSASGRRSENWSAPVAISIAEPPVISITNPFVTETDESEREYLSLKAMPLTVEVTGGGVGRDLTLSIERAEFYRMARPDGSEFDGYENEVVATKTESGVDEITLTLDDVIGSLDDGAKYRLVAVVEDSYGQTATDSIEFEIHWTHQAVMPEASVRMYKGISRITIIQPNGYEEGDSCDIYRLSADRPQLIYQGAQFGEEYADPFPAIGKSGGHRIVYRTANGDYTTEDGHIAWLDLGEDEGDLLESEKSIIDFGLEQIRLYYNQDFSTSWQKDFKYTSYLGGHVQGDWNPAVIRTGSINTVMLSILDQDTIDSMRELAEYAGICHVRTIDGSSFAADIQVTESREHDTYGHIVTYELQTTRVDAEELEGMTFEAWAEIYDHLLTPDGYDMELPDGFTLSVEEGV